MRCAAAALWLDRRGRCSSRRPSHPWPRCGLAATVWRWAWSPIGWLLECVSRCVTSDLCVCVCVCVRAVVVAEVTQPSLGVGYELGRAVDMKKKIFCLFRPSSGRREDPSFLLSFLPSFLPSSLQSDWIWYYWWGSMILQCIWWSVTLELLKYYWM